MNNSESRRIFYFLVLNLAFMLVQMLYGIWTNSLGLISDAIHMGFDCLAIGVGLFASVMAMWPPNERFTYGYGRMETLSGFANGLFLILISIFIVFEAIQRLNEHEAVGITITDMDTDTGMDTGASTNINIHTGITTKTGSTLMNIQSIMPARMTIATITIMTATTTIHIHILIVAAMIKCSGVNVPSDEHVSGKRHVNHTPPSLQLDSQPLNHARTLAGDLADSMLPTSPITPSYRFGVDEHFATHHHHHTPNLHDHSHTHSHSHEGHSHNMRGVFLHVMADTLGSVGVIISTLLIQFYGWTGFDPIASLLIALLIAASVVPLVLDTGRVLALDVSDRDRDISEALAKNLNASIKPLKEPLMNTILSRRGLSIVIIRLTEYCSQHAVKGRYTLRIRNAQQINPYSYEKTYYKNQMKSNPEAIVNTDGRRVRDSPSREGFSEENEDFDDEGWRRRQSDAYRKHSTKGHRHIIGDLTANKEDYFPSIQRESRHMESPKIRHMTSNAPIQSSPQKGANTIRWYPKVFQQESSDEESNPLGECSQSERSQASSSRHDILQIVLSSQ
ncbi:hypothetical protein EWM64_g705 [Hericium alpestre]|uniref:Cation efflux protein transmembrane domain-containing protein n=1 Tax=Hericium alpestre TaxID=135208 RepID=A0A4Z0AAE6_9AGAM|nr:hypothetical protein EWM64_g705 [Hericium alpestre]